MSLSGTIRIGTKLKASEASMKYHIQEFESNREESAQTQMINWLNTQAIDPKSIVSIQYLRGIGCEIVVIWVN